MNVQTNKKGFTIIEVVLVLAIAALIFLMIFIALPALQRGQRDTARKNDANAMASALGTYRSNSNGKLPADTDPAFTTFLSQYVDNLSQYAPDNSDVLRSNPSDVDKEESKMYIELGKSCKGTNSSRAAAVRVKLESGGGAVVCTDA